MVVQLKLQTTSKGTMLYLSIASALLSGQAVFAFAPSSLSPVRSLHGSAGKFGPSTTALYLGDFFNFGKANEEEPEVATTAASEEEPEDEVYYDEDDPIEKIFGVFFGKKEKAPAG